MGRLISTTQAAELLGVTVPRVQTFIWEGRLPALKVGRSYVIDEDDLKLVGDRKPGRPPKAEAGSAPEAAHKGATGQKRPRGGQSKSRKGTKR
jgi:excisionase family DNA binding protein